MLLEFLLNDEDLAAYLKRLPALRKIGFLIVDMDKPDRALARGAYEATEYSIFTQGA
jgi:hypothetical protein